MYKYTPTKKQPLILFLTFTLILNSSMHVNPLSQLDKTSNTNLEPF